MSVWGAHRGVSFRSHFLMFLMGFCTGYWIFYHLNKNTVIRFRPSGYKDMGIRNMGLKWEISFLFSNYVCRRIWSLYNCCGTYWIRRRIRWRYIQSKLLRLKNKLRFDIQLFKIYLLKGLRTMLGTFPNIGNGMIIYLYTRYEEYWEWDEYISMN